jgi:hypothetical protein
MRKAPWALLAGLFLVSPCFGQNYTQISASLIGGQYNLLASGTICFQATNLQGTYISFQAGGGGQWINRPFCTSVTNGAITAAFFVPNPANTSPAGIFYEVTVKSGALTLIDDKLVQWSGSGFNFDLWSPSVGTVVPPSGGTVNGPLGINGNLTVTGTISGILPSSGGCNQVTVFCPATDTPASGFSAQVNYDSARCPVASLSTGAPSCSINLTGYPTGTSMTADVWFPESASIIFPQSVIARACSGGVNGGGPQFFVNYADHLSGGTPLYGGYITSCNGDYSTVFYNPGAYYGGLSQAEFDHLQPGPTTPAGPEILTSSIGAQGNVTFAITSVSAASSAFPCNDQTDGPCVTYTGTFNASVSPDTTYSLGTSHGQATLVPSSVTGFVTHTGNNLSTPTCRSWTATTLTCYTGNAGGTGAESCGGANPCTGATVTIPVSQINFATSVGDIINSGTYSSGGTISGSTGQTCFWYDSSGGAYGTIALTGTNTISSGTGLRVIYGGSGYTSALTSVSLYSVTATCSGAATVATTIGGPSNNGYAGYEVESYPYGSNPITGGQHVGSFICLKSTASSVSLNTTGTAETATGAIRQSGAWIINALNSLNRIHDLQMYGCGEGLKVTGSWFGNGFSGYNKFWNMDVYCGDIAVLFMNEANDNEIFGHNILNGWWPFLGWGLSETKVSGVSTENSETVGNSIGVGGANDSFDVRYYEIDATGQGFNAAGYRMDPTIWPGSTDVSIFGTGFFDCQDLSGNQTNHCRTKLNAQDINQNVFGSGNHLGIINGAPNCAAVQPSGTATVENYWTLQEDFNGQRTLPLTSSSCAVANLTGAVTDNLTSVAASTYCSGSSGPLCATYAGAITGGASNGIVASSSAIQCANGHGFAVSGFTNPNNNGACFNIYASTATSVTLENPYAVAEAASGTLSFYGINFIGLPALGAGPNNYGIKCTDVLKGDIDHSLAVCVPSNNMPWFDDGRTATVSYTPPLMNDTGNLFFGGYPTVGAGTYSGALVWYGDAFNVTGYTLACGSGGYITSCGSNWASFVGVNKAAVANGNPQPYVALGYAVAKFHTAGTTSGGDIICPDSTDNDGTVIDNGSSACSGRQVGVVINPDAVSSQYHQIFVTR